MEADVAKEMLLLDSTLGVGGELIGWNYGEAVISNIRRLSIKSGLDIVEVGLLRKYPLGPGCTAYHSTMLPPGLEKEQGQRYAMLLDRDYWPDLSDIPEQSGGTVDIVRVFITNEQRDAELSYCIALSQKGYQVVTLLDEIGQYTEKELSALLQKIDAVRPWACYLFDASGLLHVEDLSAVVFQCDKVLHPDVRIGFHGCDNLQCLFEAAKAFCMMETERGLCVDVSAGGIGAGALHLSAKEFAQWMNDTFQRGYDLPVLSFQEIYTEQYVESKQGSGAQLLYYATATHKCSYRYTEYYCELSIEPSDQLEIYEEIEREFAFQFDKSAANRALLRYRKKRLNLVLIILTENQWKAVDALLSSAARELLCYGVDVVIYDSSDDERTHAVTGNFQLEGYDNVHYRRYSNERNDLSADQKVFAACAEHLNYDYIWLCHVEFIPTISQFYNELLELAKNEAEVIAVDSSERNDNRHCVKNYDNCVDFFSENAERINTLGCSVFRNPFMEKLLRGYPLERGSYGFWIPVAPLCQMAIEPVRSGLIISNVFTCNPNVSVLDSQVKGMLKTWGKNWYQAVSSLPAVYDVAKPAALKLRMPEFRPFSFKSMLMLRSLGGFNLSIYRQYRDVLSQVSISSPAKFYVAALIPKSLAKGMLNIESYWIAHPDSLASKAINKLYHIYVRLGR